jgi:hypothetical protein
MDEQTYFDNALIRPPHANAEDKRYTRVVVDSKDRDVDKHPNPSCYTIQLYDDIEDVVLAQLLTSSVPLSGYHINDYHNTIIFKLGNAITNASTSSDFMRVTLNSGNYVESELAGHIADMMTNATGGAVSFGVSYSTLTGKMMVSASQNFMIVVSSFVKRPDGQLIQFPDLYKNMSSTAKLLGLIPGSIHPSSTNTLVFPHRVNLNYFNYLVLYIDQFDLNRSSSTVLNKSFAILNNNSNSYNIAETPEVTKKFTPPLSRISKLSIKFFDRDGNPYDFNGVDHWFEMQFVSYRQKRKYFDIYQNK